MAARQNVDPTMTQAMIKRWLTCSLSCSTRSSRAVLLLALQTEAINRQPPILAADPAMERTSRGNTNLRKWRLLTALGPVPFPFIAAPSSPSAAAIAV